MPDRSFVHLHCHSHYSLLDGASRVPELVACAKKQGMNAIALTDHGNLYGAIEFYRECQGNRREPGGTGGTGRGTGTFRVRGTGTQGTGKGTGKEPERNRGNRDVQGSEEPDIQGSGGDPEP